MLRNINIQLHYTTQLHYHSGWGHRLVDCGVALPAVLFSSLSLWFFAGITLIAGVSFVDDVVGLGQKVRLLFHLLAMSCAFYLVGVFGAYPWWAIVIGYIVFIGIVNAYNFMDGINGITG